MSIVKNNILMGILFALGGFTCFAFGDVAIKYLREYYAPYTIAFYTTFFCSLILLAFGSKLGGVRASFKSPKIKLHMLRGFFLAVQFTLFIYSFAYLPMTTAYALIFTTPFIASLIAIPLLGEKVKLKQWGAILLGFAGVMIILRPGYVPLGLPVLAALVGAVFFAISNVMVRLIGEEGETILSFALIAEMVMCGLIFLLYLTNPELPTIAHLGLLVVIGMFSSAALLLIPLAFLRAPAAIVSPFHYVQMLWGIIFGYIFFGDVMDVWVATGSTIIIASGIWLIRQERGKVPDYGAL